MKKCFFISPIGQDGDSIRTNSNKVIEYILEPVLKNNYKIIRADLISTTQSISKNIINNILEADLIIADLTNHNPNVFYELAVAHTLAKPTIQIISQGEIIPFDLSHQRTITYELSLDGVKSAQLSLQEFENAIKTSPIENPVLDVLDINKINNLKGEDISVTDALKSLTIEIKKMQEILEKLKTTNQSSVTPDVVQNLNPEEKMGMILMDKLFSNPKVGEMMLSQMLNPKNL